MKRKRSQWDVESPRNPTRQKYFESSYAPSSAASEASPLSTKRTPRTSCCQHCAERCPRASSTLSPFPRQKRRALSSDHPTYQSDHTDRVRGVCRTNFHKLAVSSTTTALPAYPSRKRICASSDPYSVLLRKPARCLHLETHYPRRWNM